MHLRRSVYSSEDWKRHQSNGVVIWIDEWLAGIMEDRYAPTPPGEETDTSYLDADGLDA